ncbi:MAG: hypothetical protein KGL50_00635, partial [Burkholderiales bacterium]|nr:hypothetical protein [Burkholderiales bacterium]
MRTSARRRACGLAGWVLVGMLAWVLAGCATRAPLPEPDPARVDAPLAPAGIAVDAEWLLPPAPAAGLVLLQHGFDRSCANLRGLAASLRQRGLVVL